MLLQRLWNKRNVHGKALSIPLLVIIIVFLTSCSSSSSFVTDAGGSEGPLAWQEQYDLGLRYLSEGNYQEAILAFTAAIEIDPKQAPAYVGRGDAYVGVATIASSSDQAIEDNYNLAETDYLAAIDLDALIAEAYQKLADIYIFFDDIEAAIAILEQGYEVTGDERLMLYLEELSEVAKNVDRGNLAQGEYIDSTLPTGGRIEYRFNCVYGVPQPIEVKELESWTSEGSHTITDTIMAYMRQIDDDGVWSEWEPAPHYWAGLRCTACGEENGDAMPAWFESAFSHAWSGEWDGSPRVFSIDGNSISN